VYITDERGYLKIWDLTDIIEATCLKKVKSFKEVNLNYNSKRKEQVDASIIAATMRSE
jgi:hypothetical protein